MVVIEEPKINKTHIEKRVRDWKNRINALYSNITNEWLKGSEYSTKQGLPVSMYEPLMQTYTVNATEVDTLDIYRSGLLILTLKPKGLWMIGANGRIDILTNHGSYILVDLAEQFNSPEWKYVDINRRSIRKEFNREILLQLLSEAL
jgi:hypothetical protein